MFSEIINFAWSWITGSSETYQYYAMHTRYFTDYLHIGFDSLFYAALYIAIIFSLIYLSISFFVLFFNKDKKERDFDNSKIPFVSVQIPTRNELIALRCAKMCLDFDYPKNKYEVILGDDSDKPEVSAKLGEFAEEHKGIVNLFRRAKNTGFKPGNLNNMLEHSRGEILVIFDSDFTPGKDFLKRIVNPFIHNPNVSAVQARWNFNNFKQNMTSMLASTIVYMFHHIVLEFMGFFGSGSLCGSAEAVRKKDLIALGGWKSGSLTEDIEYSLRLHKANKKIVYLPKLECYSEVPFTPKDLYKQQMRWAYGVISSYKEHFMSLVFNKTLSLKRKTMSMFAGFGYIMPMLMAVMFVAGMLSFATHKPGPIDLARFFSEMGLNILFTSGLLIASGIALYKEKKLRYTFKTIVSSFSIGIVTTYYVNKGIIKSIMGKPMQWYLLKKEQNPDA
jgi:cellulose synthase/poly-beta-1,6-N-acetylglucosamine synthase-like glycosyltransferase